MNCAKPKSPEKSAETREPKEHVGAVDPDAPLAMPMSRATGMATFMGVMLLASLCDPLADKPQTRIQVKMMCEHR